MRVIAFILLALLTASATAKADGNLKRLTLRNDMLGWEAVGRIDLGNGAVCTGTLVSPDLVLTAAHCVYERANRRPADAMTFRAGFVDGSSVDEAAVKRIAVYPAYDPGGGTSFENVRADVALLQLARPVNGVIKPFGTSLLPAVSRRVSVVSYATGRIEAPSRESGCSVLGRDQGLLAFDCDVWFGSSGAPVFDTTGGVPRIVSLISSGSRGESSTISFGADLHGMLPDLRANLRTGRNVWPIDPNEAARLGLAAQPKRGGARFVRP